MRQLLASLMAAAFLVALPSHAGEVIREKHIIPAPAPYKEPKGAVTPDGSFNIRDANAPFHSDKLADALMLDRDGKLPGGKYLNLNHAIYTSYRLASDKTKPNTIVVLMPGTWAGAMSLNQFAIDLLRMAQQAGTTGMEVWLLDRRSEQMEDHTGLLWAEQNKGKISDAAILQGLMDYYRPAFEPKGERKELLGRKFTPLDHNAVRFMANWGADTALRDWRQVVLAAHKAVGDEVIERQGEEPMVNKKPGNHVFIGGHSLGGSLTVLYAAYDFDRRPGHELLGSNDADGLILLEGGGFPDKPAKVMDADSYRDSLRGMYKDGKVYFDMDMFGIKYAPSTMLSLALSGWAANNVRGQESVFPANTRPKAVQLPHITNEALLGFAIDNDLATFFIARVSIGYPTGKLGQQFRHKIGIPLLDPAKCGLLSPFRWPSHKPIDPNFVYGWTNIDSKPESFFYGKPCSGKCTKEEDLGPEVTDFYAFAADTYDGPDYYAEAADLSLGPNDFAEWYFPPRLSSDSAKLGAKIVEKDGTELFNAVHVRDLTLPVISFFGSDSMGNYLVPKLNAKNFPERVLKNSATQVHLLQGYTHLDIVEATRNNQKDLKPDYENFNGPAVYAYHFISKVAGWR